MGVGGDWGDYLNISVEITINICHLEIIIID